MFSQNKEQIHIDRYFKRSRCGTFLDIGAYHPENLSNTRSLAQKGWKGTFVEPNKDLWPPFEEFYGNDPAIQLLPLCVGDKCGEVEFLISSGKDLPWSDALSTIDPEWTHKWEAAGVEFKKTKCEIVDFETLIERSIHKHFDFISIDTENNVLDILEQIDPAKTRTSLFCVEWNGTDLNRFQSFFKPRGYVELYRSQENLIYGLRR